TLRQRHIGLLKRNGNEPARRIVMRMAMIEDRHRDWNRMISKAGRDTPIEVELASAQENENDGQRCPNADGHGLERCPPNGRAGHCAATTQRASVTVNLFWRYVSRNVSRRAGVPSNRSRSTRIRP